MSLQIITAVRRLSQLSGSLKFTAIELAHRASRSGHARVSYWYLAKKTGQSIRTMIRHVHRLVAMGILRKQVVWLALNRCAVNAYTFLIPGVTPLHKRARDTRSSTLPDAKTDTAKEQSLTEEIRRQRWALHHLALTPDARERVQEEIARLEGLLRC